MDQDLTAQGPHKDFEGIKHIDENGVEYWAGRELMVILNYEKWQNFEEVIGRAARACLQSGETVDNHFTGTSKMVKIGQNTVRQVNDYKLDRYACYLIAQNGDSSKPEIALAQTYFAVKTRQQEIFENLSTDEKRIEARDQIKRQNKKLASTAKQAGVVHFGSFNDAGYEGLYGMPLANVEKKKGLKKGELLDRSGVTELAANLFRITQTDEKISKENIKGDKNAAWAHNMIGGKIRRTMKEIGSTMPEDLPTEKHIKELKQDLKKPKKLKLGK